MMSFRRAVTATALAVAAVSVSAGAASAYDQPAEHYPLEVLNAQCNDATNQFGAVNVNQGPVCIDFGSDNGEYKESSQNETSAACNSAVTQIGWVNVNQGPVCIRF
ncbi:hypothetical protein BM536_036210 [Streptomyces phaeoluteigriseus]|jgi:hypothetical protein|uniref:Secreted protein n=1 Tax=Streptomyces phaeoluteigriseus TaxID=114686 RepID=A0A1V6MHY1_9ACTN|nr:hypothetical protein [Streptomyces phaeoluteigriseus]OQD52074.1 hypothetical protein BM536_036210 [Streptomyces phaeoluteigriseus]